MTNSPLPVVASANTLRQRAPQGSWRAPILGVIGLLILRALPLPDHGAIAGLPSPCGFYSLTALPCPLCGLTRSLVCAAHGNWSEAAWWNPLGPAVLSGLLVATVIGTAKVLWPHHAPNYSKVFRRRCGLAMGALAVVLWLARLGDWIASPL